MTEYDETTAVVEAALFAAGDFVSVDMLMKVTGKQKKDVETVVASLASLYESRKSGIEIVESQGRYVMQIRPDFADKVRTVAPKELTSSQLKTLSVIAYHQPITQSSIVDMRGAGAYEQIKELKDRNLISAKPSGRTKILTTTPVFSDYFGIESSDTDDIRRTMIRILKSQGSQSDFDHWNKRLRIAVTPLYESLMKMCGISEYKVVNPYTPEDKDLEILQNIDLLILSKGYAQKLNTYLDSLEADTQIETDESDNTSLQKRSNTYDFMIVEMSSTTFKDLENNMRLLQKELGSRFNLCGNRQRLEENIKDIHELQALYRDKALLITKKAYPVTEMAARILNDLNIGISLDGIPVAPDYEKNSKGKKIEGKILIPTHKNQKGNLIKRVCEKYDAVIQGLRK